MPEGDLIAGRFIQVYRSCLVRATERVSTQVAKLFGPLGASLFPTNKPPKKRGHRGLSWSFSSRTPREYCHFFCRGLEVAPAATHSHLGTKDWSSTQGRYFRVRFFDFFGQPWQSQSLHPGAVADVQGRVEVHH